MDWIYVVALGVVGVIAVIAVVRRWGRSTSRDTRGGGGTGRGGPTDLQGR